MVQLQPFATQTCCGTGLKSSRQAFHALKAAPTGRAFAWSAIHRKALSVLIHPLHAAHKGMRFSKISGPPWAEAQTCPASITVTNVPSDSRIFATSALLNTRLKPQHEHLPPLPSTARRTSGGMNFLFLSSLMRRAKFCRRVGSSSSF